MEIFKIGVIGIIASILIITIKRDTPFLSICISIVTAAIIFLMILPKIEQVISFLLDIIGQIDLSFTYISIILKIIGISYISEFCSQICVDSGQASIASKIEICGKVFIMLISIPIITDLLGLITKLMP